MMRLKELRKENGKTQDEISKFLNIAKSTYCGYELKTSEPTLDTLCKLADYYNVSLDYLIGRNFQNEVGYLSNEDKEIIFNIKKLNNTNKIKAVSFIMGLLAVQD